MNTKHNTKITAFLFIVLLLVAACSPDGVKPDKNEGENERSIAGQPVLEATTSHYDTLGERNFEGDSFKILDANNYPQWHQNLAEEINGDPVNDSLFERDRFIEGKFNTKIEYEQIVSGGCSVLEKNVRAGDATYDLVISSALGGNIEKLATNNILCNLLDAPYLSLSSAWWSRLLNENMRFDNQLFFTLGDNVPSTYLAPGTMYVNLRLMEDYGMTQNLYNLAFEGKWTLDVLESIIKNKNIDLNQDNKMHADDDFFGIISPSGAINSNIYAAGIGIKLSTNQGNTIQIDWNTPVFFEKIDRMSTLITKPAYSDVNDVISKTFHSGRAMFLAHTLEAGILFLRDMKDDYGLLPMPKYDENQENYVSFISAFVSTFTAIPSNSNIEKSAFLMEAMAYAGYNTIRPNIYEKALKIKVSRDVESAKVIDMIIESCYLDLNGLYNFGNSCEIIRAAMFDKKALASEYEKKEGAIQKDIDKFINAIAQNN